MTNLEFQMGFGRRPTLRFGAYGDGAFEKLGIRRRSFDLGRNCHRFGQLRLHATLRRGYKHRSWGADPSPRLPLDMPSRTRCTPLHYLLPAMGKKENRAVPTPDWRVFAGGDLGSTLVVGSVVAVDTVFELMRVSRTCSHGKLSEGLANKFCGLPWTVCVDRRDNQSRSEDQGCKTREKHVVFRAGWAREEEETKWPCQRWRMCVEADGRDTDRQLHISGGLECGKRCPVRGGMQLFGMLRATVSPLPTPPGVAGQLAKRLRVRCSPGKGAFCLEWGRLTLSLRCADPDSDSPMPKRWKLMVRVCMCCEKRSGR